MIFVLPAPAIRERIHTLRDTLADFDAAQGQSCHAIHEYVTNINRKFGVSNRSALMAIWLQGFLIPHTPGLGGGARSAP
ncbi:hypothetical protein FGKAn22_16740 [Ferrigenium kumadai]|uniref:Uncharacterized protein n=1 Tax=Ferrigenium kumadai TaxID=1682490 RepID=A0AAN1W0T5_9PROT|nr:hypothetical protein [Ferrigenium kumadai]BBI99981.1 hypothetical protein FGKAn22_16740 [Ferrigenium kumadai]